jgi:hypothetical protein
MPGKGAEGSLPSLPALVLGRGFVRSLVMSIARRRFPCFHIGRRCHSGKHLTCARV